MAMSQINPIMPPMTGHMLTRMIILTNTIRIPPNIDIKVKVRIDTPPPTKSPSKAPDNPKPSPPMTNPTVTARINPRIAPKIPPMTKPMIVPIITPMIGIQRKPKMKKNGIMPIIKPMIPRMIAKIIAPRIAPTTPPIRAPTRQGNKAQKIAPGIPNMIAPPTIPKAVSPPIHKIAVMIEPTIQAMTTSGRKTGYMPINTEEGITPTIANQMARTCSLGAVSEPPFKVSNGSSELSFCAMTGLTARAMRKTAIKRVILFT